MAGKKKVEAVKPVVEEVKAVGYTALISFIDSDDDNYEYSFGEVYPRDGYTPKDERIAYLASNKNNVGHPVIGIKEGANVNESSSSSAE